MSDSKKSFSITVQILEADREVQEVVDDLDAEFGEDQWHDRYSIETITADMLDPGTA